MVQKIKGIFGSINGLINDLLVKVLFERIPGLKKAFEFVDGKKTIIGRIGLVITVALQATIELWPEGDIVSQTAIFLLGGVSWFLTEFGLRHKVVKGEIFTDKEKADE